MLNVKLKKNENLLKVLGALENLLSINTGDNKLKFVKLANNNGKLQISGRNPYMRLEYNAEGISEIAGECALYDCKTLYSLINVIDDDIEINDGVIKCAKVKYNIPCENGDNYPNDVFPKITNWCELNTNNFINAITNVAAATDKVTDGALSGIFIDNDKLLACDSKRLFMQKACFNENIKDNILPKELIKYLLKLPFNDKMYFTIFGENIIIKDENVTIASTRLAANYPKVEAILPKDIRNILTIKKEDFYNALTLVTPIIDDDTKACNLEYDSKKMKIYVDNGIDKAETSIKIEADKEIKENIKVKFNINLLIDMLKVNQETIEVKTYNDNIGYMFSSNGSMQYIMPLVN